MKTEAPVLVVFGENAKTGYGREFIETQPDFMGPVSRISATATAAIAKHAEYRSEVLFVGCDPFGTGREESIQMRDMAVGIYPGMEGRSHVLTGLLDTSMQAEAVAEEIKARRRKPEVSVVLPIEHAKRASGQLRAFGLSIKDLYIAHEAYILDPGISRGEKRERIRLVRDVYFTPQMYLDIMREFGLNVIGKIDNKGLLIRKLSEHFRGNINTNTNAIR